MQRLCGLKKVGREFDVLGCEGQQVRVQGLAADLISANGAPKVCERGSEKSWKYRNVFTVIATAM